MRQPNFESKQKSANGCRPTTTTITRVRDMALQKMSLFEAHGGGSRLDNNFFIKLSRQKMNLSLPTSPYLLPTGEACRLHDKLFLLLRLNLSFVGGGGVRYNKAQRMCICKYDPL